MKTHLITIAVFVLVGCFIALIVNYPAFFAILLFIMFVVSMYMIVYTSIDTHLRIKRAEAFVKADRLENFKE